MAVLLALAACTASVPLAPARTATLLPARTVPLAPARTAPPAMAASSGGSNRSATQRSRGSRLPRLGGWPRLWSGRSTDASSAPRVPRRRTGRDQALGLGLTALGGGGACYAGVRSARPLPVVLLHGVLDTAENMAE